MATLDDLAKAGFTVVPATDHYADDESEKLESSAPTYTSYWVEGEGLKTMVNWPVQNEDDQAAIDYLVEPPVIAKSTEPTFADIINSATTLDELKEKLITLLG